jgi:sporulation protein YlmC with PRC-barrel domain
MRKREGTFGMTLRLSEVELEETETRQKILGAPVVTIEGKQVGTIEKIYLTRDFTAKKAVIKNTNGLRIIVPAERLILKDSMIVLQEPPQADILRAMKETCRALIELLEAFEEDDPQEGAPSLSAARKHLKSALKALDTGKSAE